MACGFILTALFTDCDPVKAGVIQDQTQYLPYLVAELFRGYHGMSGLFVAGIFSASLSTISSGINSMAAVLWEDVFLEFQTFKSMTKSHANTFVKVMSLALGVVPIVLALLIQFVGGHIMTIGITLDSLLSGAFCTIITAAYFVRFINLKGLIFGSILGTIFSGWLIIGQIVYKPPGEDLLPTNYTEGCDPFNASARVLSEIEASTADNYVTTMTTTTAMTITTTAPITAKGMNSTTADDSIDWDSFPYVLYRTSYMWISPFNFFFTFIATCLISIATGGLKLDPPDEYLFSWEKFLDQFRDVNNRKLVYPSDMMEKEEYEKKLETSI